MPQHKFVWRWAGCQPVRGRRIWCASSTATSSSWRWRLLTGAASYQMVLLMTVPYTVGLYKRF
eukprot:3082295-Amphidinium_carterae.1